MKKKIVWTNNTPGARAKSGTGITLTHHIDPSVEVKRRVKDLWGNDATCSFNVEQIKGNDRAVLLGCQNGVQFVTLRINDSITVTSWHMDLDKAMKGLIHEVEKKFKEMS